MNNTVILAIVVGVAALAGGFAVFKGVRSVRAPRQYAGARFYWDEPAAESFSTDPGGQLAVLIHRTALVLTGSIAIAAALLRAQLQPVLSLALGWPGLLEDLVVVCALWIIGFAWGVSFFGPLAERLGGAHHYAVSDDGLLIGGNLLPWSSFSHFTLNAERGMVYIWSASLPGALGMVTAPSHPQSAEGLAAVLQEHLPSTDPLGRGHVAEWTLAARMALLGLPFMVVAALLSAAPLLPMLAGDAVLVWALLMLGAALINRMLYADKARPVLAAS